MSRLQHSVISTGDARCVRCDRWSTLTVSETRYVRSWREVLDRHFDAAPARTASCAACGTTYPVRAADRTGCPASRRRDHADLPADRDWEVTAVQV